MTPPATPPPQLLPCPFCGQPAAMTRYRNSEVVLYGVEHADQDSQCPIQAAPRIFMASSKAAAAELWNTRADSAPLQSLRVERDALRLRASDNGPCPICWAIAWTPIEGGQRCECCWLKEQWVKAIAERDQALAHNKAMADESMCHGVELQLMTDEMDQARAEAGRWIPCAERMPETDWRHYLLVAVSCDNGAQFVACDRYNKHSKSWSEHGGDRPRDESGYDGRHVTHWMELPAHPIAKQALAGGVR